MIMMPRSGILGQIPGILDQMSGILDQKFEEAKQSGSEIFSANTGRRPAQALEQVLQEWLSLFSRIRDVLLDGFCFRFRAHPGPRRCVVLTFQAPRIANKPR